MPQVIELAHQLDLRGHLGQQVGQQARLAMLQLELAESVMAQQPLQVARQIQLLLAQRQLSLVAHSKLG